MTGVHPAAGRARHSSGEEAAGKDDRPLEETSEVSPANSALGHAHHYRELEEPGRVLWVETVGDPSYSA